MDEAKVVTYLPAKPFIIEIFILLTEHFENEFFTFTLMVISPFHNVAHNHTCICYRHNRSKKGAADIGNKYEDSKDCNWQEKNANNSDSNTDCYQNEYYQSYNYERHTNIARLFDDAMGNSVSGGYDPHNVLLGDLVLEHCRVELVGHKTAALVPEDHLIPVTLRVNDHPPVGSLAGINVLVLTWDCDWFVVRHFFL